MRNPPVDRPFVMDRIKADYRKRDPAYDAKYNTLAKRAGDLAARVDPRTQPISQQMVDESNWVIRYTDDWPRASALLDRLQASLADTNQALSQQADGSWGPGCTEWYRKLEPTVDALNQAQQSGIVGKLSPLSFRKPLEDPTWVVTYLDSLRTSRIGEAGRNNRDEFGAVLTELSQLIFKPELRKFLVDHYAELDLKISSELEARYTKYLWDLQSPVTGFWGPSYSFPDGPIEVQDVSFTFHIVHYYDDYDLQDRRSVPRLPLIAATTLAIQKYQYPNGWVTTDKPPRLTDHNNYDVVTLFADCWQAVDAGVQKQMAPQVRRLLDWCFNSSIHDGQFDRPSDMTPADSYYYGVRFLQVAGFWDATAPWGQLAGPPGSLQPKPLAENLLQKFNDAFYDGSESADRVRSILGAVIAGTPLPSLGMV